MGSLRRIALVALLAIASSAFLPLAHVAAGHSGDGGVCSVVAHGGARVADVAPTAPQPVVRACLGVEDVVAAPSAPRHELDSCSARAPPAFSVAA